MQSVCVEIKVHTRHRASRLTMGARGGTRDCAGTSRSPSGKDDDTPSDSGASVRHDQVLDGSNALSPEQLPKVATEMALNVLAYNIKRVMAIIGVAGLLEALAT